MPESQHRAGVFDAVAGVALLFMVIGIALAVLQWVNFKSEPTAVLRTVESTDLPRVPDAAGETGTETEGDDTEYDDDDDADGPP